MNQPPANEFRTESAVARAVNRNCAIEAFAIILLRFDGVEIESEICAHAEEVLIAFLGSVEDDF